MTWVSFKEVGTGRFSSLVSNEVPVTCDGSGVKRSETNDGTAGGRSHSGG